MLQLSDSDLVKTTVLRAPVSRSVVSRYVAGESVPEAVSVAAELRTTNRLSTLDYLGEDTTDLARAEATRDTYVHLIEALAEAELAPYGAAEVSVKLSAVGQALPQDGDAIALEQRPRHLRGRGERRHHGHPRHGGPHHDRPHPRGRCASCARTSRGSAR